MFASADWVNQNNDFMTTIRKLGSYVKEDLLKRYWKINREIK